MNNKTTNLSQIFIDNSKILKPLKTNIQDCLLPKTTNIKAILFDIYGTLFISSSGDIGIHGNLDTSFLFADTLKKSGVKFIATKIKVGEQASKLYSYFIEQSHKKSKTKGIKFPEVKIENIWKSLLLKLIKEDLIKEQNFSLDQLKYIAALYESQINNAWPMPNLKKILLFLKNKSYKLGIISNAQFYTPYLFEAFLKRNLNELGFSNNLITYSYKTGIGKPDLFMYKKSKKSLQEQGINTSETLYIGNDMLKDIYPANKVGFKTVLFAGDKRSLRLREETKECKNLKADYTITNLNQLRLILGTN